MIVYVWTRNDGSGVLPEEFRRGDVFQVKPDTWEPNIGDQEQKSWLIVHMPDPPNAAAVREAFQQPKWKEGVIDEYGIPVIEYPASRFLPYWLRLTPEELVIADDPLQTLGVLRDRFTVQDVIAKN